MICENCFRNNTDTSGNVLHNIEIKERLTIGMHFGKALSSFPRNYTKAAVKCCRECYEILVCNDINNSNDWEFCWCAFIWKLINSLDTAEDLTLMWRLLPLSLRIYWYTIYQTLCNKYDINISLDLPSSYFDDVTEKADKIDTLNSSGKLYDLMQSCNENCYCSVMCPWGCTEFVDECGYISFNRFLTIKFPHKKMPLNHSSIKVKHSNKLKNCNTNIFIGMRNDYLEGQYDFMDSKEWKVQPSLRRVTGKGLFICTCQEHDGGCSLNYIHPPRNPFTSVYPSSTGDQLSHAVLAPRVVKPIKCNKYSDTYQMQDCYGGYKGVDSCDLLDIGNYSNTNTISENNISLSLYGRQDIRSKLSQLVYEKILPCQYEQQKLDMMEESLSEESLFKIRDCLSGSNFISFEDALSMHFNEELMSKFVFQPTWPMSLVQTYISNSDEGFKPYTLPCFRSVTDLRYPWITLSIICSIPSFWECMNKTVCEKKMSISWHGFLLDYAANNVFKYHKNHGVKSAKCEFKNPYHHKNMNPLQLLQKMELYNDTIDIINDEHSNNDNSHFSYNKFATMLNSMEGVSIVRSIHEVEGMMKQTNNSNHQTLKFIILLQEKRTDNYLNTFEMEDNNHQKIFANLIYVCNISSGDGLQKFNNWNCTGFSMPQSKEHIFGWKFGRGCDAVYSKRELFEANIIIYEIKTSDQSNCSNKELKKQYMEYMGSNVTQKCILHHLPMSTMAVGNGYTCCNVLQENNKRCKRAGFLECPITTCYYKLCKKCSLATPVYTETHGLSDFIQGDNIEKNEFKSKATNISRKHQLLHDRKQSATACMTNMDNMVLVELNFDEDATSEDSDEQNESQGFNIPTTNAAKKVMKTVLKERKSKFGLHVLLNEHCNLLVRRGSQLKPSRAAKGFLERIVATSDGESIPLLYPESMIFPSIFWKQNADGSYPGALPVGLWTTSSEAHKQGFAGIPEHMRCRIKNSSLLCSTDPRYMYFAFDSVYNVMSSGIDNRIVFKRGFEHMLGPCTITGQNNDSLLSSDMIDSRHNVQKLAALVRDREPTYFYTHTCNQKDHFGIAPLRTWLGKKLENLLLDTSLSETDYEELCNSFHLAAAVQIIRTWFKVGKLYMNYILTSHEYPLGNIERHWWRWEYQDAKGNLPHIHCLLWTNESKHNPADLQKLQDRIRCSQKTFFVNKEEVESLVQEGLLPDASQDTVMDMLEYVDLILTHNCANAHYRCMRRTGIGKQDLKCRFVDNFMENPDPNTYGYKKIDPRHRQETMEILQKLGLYNEEGVELDYRFIAGKYVYPAEKGELMSPCNPRLFVAHKSSDNLVITDTYFSCRYLAKYVQGIDENCKVQLKGGKGDNKIVMEEQQTTNTKITSGRILENQRDQKMKNNPSFMGRAIGLPEIIGLLLQEKQVFTNSTFFSIPTVPLEQRPAHEKRNAKGGTSLPSPGEHSMAGVGIGQGNLNFVSDTIRKQLNLPHWRQFTDNEATIIQDALTSPLSLDAITIYSCRPPELRFINSPVLYFKYFTRVSHRPRNTHTGKTTTENLVKEDASRSGWVDGLDCQILVKPPAIKLVMRMKSCPIEITTLLQVLNYVSFGILADSDAILETPEALSKYKVTFIDSKYGNNEELPFPLFNVVKPTQTNRFLIHILLSMGTFDNEASLFQGQHIKDFFSNASLISCNKTPTEDDVIRIVRDFVIHQLLYIPGGTMMFDRYCIAAYDSIKNALLSGSVICNDIPSYLHTSLVTEANVATAIMLQNMTSSLAKSVCQLPNTPAISKLICATKEKPLHWTPHVQRLLNQTDESFTESTATSNLTTNIIDSYVAASLTNTPSLLICGGPGTGKTFQMQMAATYALSKGLTTIITAIMAERALYLGGRHLHYLFCISADNTRNVHKLIDQCIRGLNNNPEKLYLLRVADVIFIDEMGYMSANLLNVIDTVLRKVRGKSSFMGGVLLIGTIDDQQLPPVKAIPLLISSLIPTSFRMTLLLHSVRARDDTNLQQLINISRKLNPTEDDIHEFRYIIINECSHVHNWNDSRILQGTMRILGTKKALLKAEQEYYAYIGKQGLLVVTREAETSQCCIGSHGNWKIAENNICESLNRYINEVQTLKLHQNMIVEMTYNKVNVWSHSQIGIILQLPTNDDLNKWKHIDVVLAPVGINKLPNGVISRENLLQNGWKEVKVGTAPENEVRMYGKIAAKRKQYAIKPRIAMTIHKALGGDFGSVATSVNFSNRDFGYRLWQKEQVEVLISRTHTTKDLIFVGDPTETADNLVELLFKVSPFSVYMRQIVDRMTSDDPSNFILQPLRHLPYNVRNTIIPSQSDSGYVYLLLSLRDYNTTYIGETNNINRRVSEHNKGIGSKVTTSPSLRPWYPIAFITGFDLEDNNDRLQLESSWQHRRNKAGKASQNIIDILHMGKYLVSEKNATVYKYAKLKFVQCIEFV